jgi:hypothetical protein
MNQVLNMGLKRNLLAVISLVSAAFVVAGLSIFWVVEDLNSGQTAEVTSVNVMSKLKDLENAFSTANLLGMDIIVDHYESPSDKVKRRAEYGDLKKEQDGARAGWVKAFKDIKRDDSGKLVLANLDHLMAQIEQLIEAIDRGEKDPAVYSKFDEEIDSANVQGSKELKSSQDFAYQVFADAADANHKIILKLMLLIGFSFAATLLILWGIGLPIVMKTSGAIQQVFHQLLSTSQSIGETSQSLGTTSHQLSESSSQSAAAIQQSVSAMAQMGAMLSQTARNATDTAHLAKSVLEQSNEGSHVMNEMSKSMRDISDASARLNEIVKVIEDITAKTTVINDVVFKTQLLAVNASIEAARAGQHGKGFAVVANEVASLAALSGKASNEIRDLLQTSSVKVADIIQGTSHAVKQGEGVNAKSSDAFQEIARSISEISDKVDQISAASKEQESGVNQTTAALSQLNQATSQTNVMAHKNLELSCDLRAQSGSLNEIGSVLSQVVLGQNDTANMTARGDSNAAGVINFGRASRRVSKKDGNTGAGSLADASATGHDDHYDMSA